MCTDDIAIAAGNRRSLDEGSPNLGRSEGRPVQFFKISGATATAHLRRNRICFVSASKGERSCATLGVVGPFPRLIKSGHRPLRQIAAHAFVRAGRTSGKVTIPGSPAAFCGAADDDARSTPRGVVFACAFKVCARAIIAPCVTDILGTLWRE